MKILVFGGTRFIGKHIVSELLIMGHDVTIATRGITKDAYEDRVQRIIVDRNNRSNLKKIFSNLTYDIVIDGLAFSSNDVKFLLDSIKCKRYIQISSAAVYHDLHKHTNEDEFNACQETLLYCDKDDFAYNEVKRQAECAIAQDYPHIASVRIRFPFVIGQDDYTKRLSFYVEHVINGQPMYIDNLHARMAFVRSDEAGKFVASFVENNFEGAINGASPDSISIHDILEYVKTKTGKEPLCIQHSEPSPYNGMGNYDLDISKANALGFSFSPLKDWIYNLVDYYIHT